MDRILSRIGDSGEKTGLGYLRNQAFYKIAIAFARFGFLPIFFGRMMFFKEGIILMNIRNIYQKLENIAENLQRNKEVIGESEKQYRSLFERSAVGISYFTSDGYYCQ